MDATGSTRAESRVVQGEGGAQPSQPEMFVPGLCIKPEWVSRILAVDKTMELRGTRPTNNLGRIIYLIRSGPSRAVVGRARLARCVGPMSLEDLENTQGAHCAGDFVDPPYPKTYGWVIEEVVAFDAPLEYSHPLGAITWVRLPARKFATAA